MTSTSDDGGRAPAAARAPRRGRRAAAGWLALAAAVGLLACGGDGVDSGGTGMAPATLAVGPVAGFGSIVVNGVHFDDTGTPVTDEEGRPAAAPLALGAMTQVEATAVATVDTPAGPRREARAESIKVIEQVVGPVQSVDAAAGRLTVLGQRVSVTPDTAFDAALAGGLGRLATGTVLAVHGQVDRSTGRIVATRLEPRPGATAFVLRAPATAYDAAGRRVQLGGVAIDLSGIAAGALPATLADGTLARARLATAPVAGAWVAADLRVVALSLGQRENVELEGRITQFGSPSSFAVDGVPVDASAATFPDGSAALAVGVRVEVEGRSEAGTLIARKVEIEREDGSNDRTVELEGRITALDAGAQTFIVRGVTVSVAGSVRYEGGTAADLALNVKVHVKGRLAADRTTVLASSIEFGD